MQKKVVITGGPGTGKSTLIKKLISKGYYCMNEVSREVTLEARTKGIEQLFLTEPLLFSNLLLEKRQHQYKEADKEKKSPVFFDRGIPDIQAYLEFYETPYTINFEKINSSFNYQNVFCTPPWKEIYTQDNERYETFEQAVVIHEKIMEAYLALGYSPIEIPFGTPEERIHFILRHCEL